MSLDGKDNFQKFSKFLMGVCPCSRHLHFPPAKLVSVTGRIYLVDLTDSITESTTKSQRTLFLNFPLCNPFWRNYLVFPKDVWMSEFDIVFMTLKGIYDHVFMFRTNS